MTVIVTLSGVGRFSSSLSLLSFSTSPTSITLTVLTAARRKQKRKNVRERSKRLEEWLNRRKVEMRRGRGYGRLDA